MTSGDSKGAAGSTVGYPTDSLASYFIRLTAVVA